jgi:hypothetical protein
MQWAIPRQPCKNGSLPQKPRIAGRLGSKATTYTEKHVPVIRL